MSDIMVLIPTVTILIQFATRPPSEIMESPNLGLQLQNYDLNRWFSLLHKASSLKYFVTATESHQLTINWHWVHREGNREGTIGSINNSSLESILRQGCLSHECRGCEEKGWSVGVSERNREELTAYLKYSLWGETDPHETQRLNV